MAKRATAFPLSPWKPCGSYATFSPAAWLVGLEKGEGGDSSLCRWGTLGLRVEGGEDTVLNVTWMQYLKAAQRQYSTLSSFSVYCCFPWLLLRRHLCDPLYDRLQQDDPESAALTLTQHYPPCPVKQTLRPVLKGSQPNVS
ncbi:hypothetical protein K0M31_017577 [Melipona bicolor]|uniref:Uncharacterized protein n=1 Tax=Melipona bicolor TaxID=60889 RepID=A0AA40G589_9HYME|nr:hypothetical protein K0M31_017577 [Melipona bicolor]